jgi:transposase
MQNNNSKPKDWREARRFQALKLKAKGWKQNTIATALDVSEGAVSQWFKRAEEQGAEALHTQPKAGAPRKLSLEQLAHLPSLLTKGASAYGFSGEVWTSDRVAWLIEFEFGVKYHRAHVSKMLRQLGYSVQKPITRATQRDEEAIAHFREHKWPSLKKKPRRRATPSSG